MLYLYAMEGIIDIDGFIEHWKQTGGSELANTQSFINGLCRLIGVEPPHGSRVDDSSNDYVFERRVFQDNGDGTQSFGRIDCYRRDCFILEAKQGSEGDRAAAGRGEDDLDFFGQTATARLKRGTAKRGTPGWAKAMVQAKGQAGTGKAYVQFPDRARNSGCKSGRMPTHRYGPGSRCRIFGTSAAWPLPVRLRPHRQWWRTRSLLRQARPNYWR